MQCENEDTFNSGQRLVCFALPFGNYMKLCLQTQLNAKSLYPAPLNFSNFPKVVKKQSMKTLWTQTLIVPWLFAAIRTFDSCKNKQTKEKLLETSSVRFENIFTKRLNSTTSFTKIPATKRFFHVVSHSLHLAAPSSRRHWQTHWCRLPSCPCPGRS